MTNADVLQGLSDELKASRKPAPKKAASAPLTRAAKAKASAAEAAPAAPGGKTS